MPSPPTDMEVVLELFVQGQSAQSNAALHMVHRLCEEHFQGRYRLDVIDVQQQPERTRSAKILAVPTLLRQHPEPAVRIFGSLSELRVLQALGFAASDGEKGET